MFGCSIPGGVQSQAGCGSGQPGLVVGDPAHSRGLKLDDHCGRFQPKLLYDSMKSLKVCIKNAVYIVLEKRVIGFHGRFMLLKILHPGEKTGC